MRFLSLLGFGKTSRRASGRRRPSPPRLDPRRRRRVGAAVLVVAALGGATWLWTSGAVERRIARIGESLLQASADSGLRIADVLVEGRNRTERSTLLEILEVARDAPILAFDPHAARDRLEALPWVRRARVERRLPDLVYVRLDEREPLALWQEQGRLSVIDETGDVIDGAAPEAFAHLPVLVGADAPSHAASLLGMLASEPDLGAKVVAAVRVQGRRWNLRLDNGVDVRLPEEQPAAAWAQLATIQREHGLLERDVRAIDLRLPDRLVVQTAPGVEPTPLPPKGKDT